MVAEEVDPIVGIFPNRYLGYSGRPPGIPDDFRPNDLPQLELLLFLLAFLNPLHLNITNNIFILPTNTFPTILVTHPTPELNNHSA
jgi:hypothetical protein